jgi:CelD/BcsL family acetyltransferase involved in cellulose biosynthesis
MANVPAALDLLVEACRQLPWPVLWFDAVVNDSPRWRAFAAALNRAGMPWTSHQRAELEIGLVDLKRDWEQIQSEWSGNHRRHMRKAERRAEIEGGVQLRFLKELTAGEVEPLLRQGFEVEDRSWKGVESESSVLRKPGLSDFFNRQAQQLAQWGQLALVFLDHQGQPIGFEYGWNSKGVYFSPKVGYDAAFQQLSPGQLLRVKLLERLVTDREHVLWDFFGPLSDATAKWTTSTYRVGRLVVGTSPVAGRLFLSSYKTLRPLVRRLRGKPAENDGSFEPAVPAVPEDGQPILELVG